MLTFSRSAGLSYTSEGANLGVEFAFRFGAALAGRRHHPAVGGKGAVRGAPITQNGHGVSEKLVGAGHGVRLTGRKEEE